MIGTVNGLVFLPVLLSLAGPGPEVGFPSIFQSELVLTGEWMKLKTLLLVNTLNREILIFYGCVNNERRT